MGSRYGGDPSQLRLADVVRDIERIDAGLAIYRQAGPLVEYSVRVALVDLETAGAPAGMTYLLAVRQVRDVLRDWKRWRGDREPSLEEACAAVVFYATHDAFQPTE